ncbi:hydroxysqualene dehydroxylase HpnE [Streptomyces sp. TP-A0874]|uniref:hydroxysqualene dehydroxylase HpnE n=1 Tax=Streptomyces sp. TP-A0874 TaxID=549819 RepID=UPI000852E3BA|nr:hydroxysqualene dehydroxylase HpnE [Streptomyces sp. TP-A0874]
MSGGAGPVAGRRRAARRAVVIGGGIAGTTAALALADAGVQVVLVEGRPRLGGLAFSFRRPSPVGELTVDNGHHVYLRCCTAYRGLLDRIGAAELAPLQKRLDIPVVDAEHRRVSRLRRTALPVPLHLAGSLARYRHLSLRERLSVGRAALALGRLDLDDPELDRVDFASWLRARGQSERTVEALWDLVGVATLNARAHQASLALAAMVFQTGLLSDPGAADLGWARTPLGEVHHTRAGAALEAAGVRVLLQTRAVEIRRTGEDDWCVPLDVKHGRAAGGGDEELCADTVVLAVPQEEAHRLLPEGAVEHPERLLGIGTAPILNAHVVYDRPVLRQPFLAALGSSVQWVFDRTEASGMTGEGQYLVLSQSAAQDGIDQPVAALRKHYLPELERLLPDAREAEVLDFFVTRERTATFAAVPGVNGLRPATATGLPGIHLAGAWTDTGWPATMEGAVRSGTAAARAAVARLARPAHPPLAVRRPADPQQEAAI